MPAFREITDVQFGPATWLRLVGKDMQDNLLTVDLSMIDLAKVAPRLLHAAQLWDEVNATSIPEGTSVPYRIVHARQPKAYPGADNKEPCFVFSTGAGEVRIHLSTPDAIACGRDLQTIGAAASPPAPKKDLN